MADFSHSLSLKLLLCSLSRVSMSLPVSLDVDFSTFAGYFVTCTPACGMRCVELECWLLSGCIEDDEITSLGRVVLE